MQGYSQVNAPFSGQQAVGQLTAELPQIGCSTAFGGCTAFTGLIVMCVVLPGRRLLAPAPAMAPAQGAAAYNGADITAHVSATPNSGPLALGGPAGSVQALLSSCTRSQVEPALLLPRTLEPLLGALDASAAAAAALPPLQTCVMVHRPLHISAHNMTRRLSSLVDSAEI